MNTENNYDQNEATILDGSNNEVKNENVNENVSEQPKAKEGDHSWKKVAMGTGTGILLGSVATLLTSSAVAKPIEIEDVQEEQEEENHPEYVDDTIAIATSVNDDMSFSEAFAAARNEVGSGGAFEWRGNVYSTFTANEWDNMTAQEHAEYGSHFNWSAHEGANSHYMAQNNGDHHNNVVETSANEVKAEAEVAVVDAHEPEVEVLGVVHDNETGMNIGGMTIDGQEVLLFDVDGDHSFDIAASDLNHDGSIEENEVADISQSGITVEGLASMANPNDDLYAGNDDVIEDGMYEA